MNKNRFDRSFSLKLIVVVFLLVLASSQIASTSPVSPNLAFDDLPGGQATYTVKTNGTYYWAVASNGSIKFESANASYTFNSANTNTASSGGGIISIGPGTFSISTTIIESNKVTFVGSGMEVTKLRATSGLTGAILKIQGSADGVIHYGGVESLTLDGSLVVSGAGGQYGLHLYKAQRTTSRNVYIYNTWDSGLFIEGTGTGNDESVLNTFYSLYVINCGRGENSVHNGSTTIPAGVELSNYTPDNVFFNLNAGANYRAGVYLYSSGNRHIIGSHIWGSVAHPGTYGIYLSVTARDKIEGTEIEHMGRDLIRVYGGSYSSSNSGGSVIVGNTLNGGSYGNAGNYDGIFIYADGINASDITITGNHIWDRASVGSKTQRYGINLHEVNNVTSHLGYINNLVLADNDFGDDYTGSATGALIGLTNMNGSNPQIHDNVGYELENTGYTTSVINGTWVAHGVDLSPNYFTFSIQGSIYKNSTCFYLQPTRISSNSTHFQIGFYIYNAGTVTAVAASNAKTIYWEAAYKRQP